MWTFFESSYDCLPVLGAALMQGVALLDSDRNYEVNAVAYGLLEAAYYPPTMPRERAWFQEQFGLKFVLRVPIEESVFTLARPLWDRIYAELDAGHVPNQDKCPLLRFPASQGGAWPVRWPQP